MNLNRIKYLVRKFQSSNSDNKILNFSKKAAFVSVFIGSFALITALSILDGFEKILTESTAKFTSDITVINMAGDYVDIDSVNIEKNNDINSISKVVEHPVIIRKGKEIDGFLAKGISPKDNANNLKGNITEGENSFSSNVAKEIILSEKISKLYDINLNDEIVLYSIKTDGQDIPKTNISKFKVIGIYNTGLGEFDKSYVFIPLGTSKSFFEIPGNLFSRLEIDLKENVDISRKSNEIEAGLNYPYIVKNVFDYQRTALVWIQVQKEPVPLVLGIITLVAILNVVTMLLILIVEKTKQIGILKTLGMSTKDIVKMFVYIGASIAVKASIAGSAFAFALMYIQKEFKLIKIDSSVYFLDTIPIDINPIHYILVIGVSLLLSLTVVTIPALAASKINPIKILRFS